MNNILKIISTLLLIILAYFLVTNFFLAIKLPPAGGDSYWYHVPIAKNILNGNFIFQENIVQIEQWYPGASEGILAIFIFLGLPVNLFNILGILILSIVLYKFGYTYLNNKTLSLIFSLSLATSYGIFRLALSQNIDIWVAIYFLILLMLFEKPKNHDLYFLICGFFSGMFVGSKYAALLFFLVLLLVYGKRFIKNLNVKRILLFLVPFTIFGLFWYIRNLVLTGSPFYPQSILFFKGLPGWHSYLSVPIWGAFIKTPRLMLDAYISEFMIWPALFLVIPLFLIYVKKSNKNYNFLSQLKRILTISVLFFLIYLFLPYDNLYLGMLLSVRYIYSIFILLALTVFLIAQKFKAENILAVMLLTQTFVLFYQPYHPKLLFIYEPLVFGFILLIICRTKLLKILTKYIPL